MLEACKAKLFETCDVGLGERLVREVGERSTPPEFERFSVLGTCSEALEAIEIELVRIDSQLVAGRHRDDSLATESLTQLRNVDPQGLRRGSRRAVSPERLDQRVGRNNAIGA